uniref:Putative secreted protein n=1 Tax=Ixodes ricinus TaxID=34613 RepID=A0A6B0U2J1_IXORI
MVGAPLAISLSGSSSGPCAGCGGPSAFPSFAVRTCSVVWLWFVGVGARRWGLFADVAGFPSWGRGWLSEACGRCGAQACVPKGAGGACGLRG